MDNSNVCVIVPIFNEEQVVRSIVQSLVAEKFTTVIVDDGSSDNSLQSISDLSVKILKHSTNFGQGAALQTGFEFAKKNPNLEIFVTFDADGQHQTKDIKNIIAPIKENKVDIVFGTRFQDDKTQMPLLKRIILKIAIKYTNLSTGVPLTDAHNGFRAMNRTALNEMKLNLNGMAHASEIVTVAHKANLRVAEIPVEILYTKYSKAKGQSILNSINILSDLFLR
jgi:glycosyltransferase involved in cell wall biosynthesis